jgi:hypothetical protein
MKRKPSWLKKFKLAPAGLVGRQVSNDRPVESVRFQEVCDRPPISVPAARMQSGLWGLAEGDIAAAYTADARPKIRKPFTHEGQLWANWGGSDRDVCCTPLTPFTLHRGNVFPEAHTRRYEGLIVNWKRQSYVCGPEHEFRAEPRGPGAEIDLARRMFAYGGYFASSAGSYRALLREWIADGRHTEMQCTFYAIEADAPLPQTQAGMRALIEGQSEQGSRPNRVRSSPPRFNPWTGQTAA